MKLYHGTNEYFDRIDLLKSKPNKDFGRGFYLSPTREQALDLAEARVRLVGGEPIVMEYFYDESKIETNALRVLRFDDYSENWARFILANRNNRTSRQVHDYDIVIGPIANDRVGRQLWRYENRDIDMTTLVRNLKYMRGAGLTHHF